MMSLYAVVTVFTAAVISSTVAVQPCDQTIIELLRKCYKDGNPPSLTPPGQVMTHVAISEGETPDDSKCVIGKVTGNTVAVTIFGANGRDDIPYQVTHEPKTDHILETNFRGTFKLYVIHNEANVMSYYRCMDASAATEFKPTPMGEVIIDCNNRVGKFNDVIQQAKDCFNDIGITNVKDITPCDVSVCS